METRVRILANSGLEIRIQWINSSGQKVPEQKNSADQKICKKIQEAPDLKI